jgi:AraC-like DNA-binding protein
MAEQRSFDPSQPDFTPYGFTCELWAKKTMPRPNRHNEIELNFLTAGSITYLLGGRRAAAEAGRLAAFWAAIPHQIVAVEGNDPYHAAHLPLAWFLQCRLPGDFVQRLLRGEMVVEPDDRRAGFDRQLFAQWQKDLAGRPDERWRTVLLEIEARLWRLADAQGRRAPKQRTRELGSGGVQKVESMAAFIAQHYTEPLTIARVARAVDLHPNYAMTLFRGVFGTTLLEYLTQLRVSHAQRLLATTDAKILDVAMSSGFGSLSRFNAAFSRVCGCAPSAYRATVRPGT